MKELLARLHYLLTGIRGDDVDYRGEPWTLGSGDLSALHVVLGWDNMTRDLPNSWYPLLVIEPTSANESQRGGGPQKITTYQVTLTLGVLVPSKLGALFGRRDSVGIADLEELLRERLKSDRKLENGGAPYLRDLQSINLASQVEVRGRNIVKRYFTLTTTWDKITF